MRRIGVLIEELRNSNAIESRSQAIYAPKSIFIKALGLFLYRIKAYVTWAGE